MPTSTSLDELDPEQRDAAAALRGPVVILAGAGTGKTRTITHRIAHGVRVGAYDPARVLALTFTRKAAAELQERLHRLDVAGVQARTFHGAALAQLGYFWTQAVGGEAPRVLSGKVHLLGQAADAVNLRLDQETLRDIAAEIEWRKVSMLTFDAYERELHERGSIGELTIEQLIDVQRTYETIKNQRKHVDFEDVLILLSGMLHEEPAIAQQVRERYRFFTVDEYQDVSPLQHELLRVWLGERDDVCVVGDASQTIYTFAGASQRFLLGFAREFRGAKEFRLERNYRSTPEIIVRANSLMNNRPGALRLLPTRRSGHAEPVFEWFESDEEEATAIAALVRARLDDGRSAADIALLYRSHTSGMLLEQELRHAGVSVQMNGGTRFFERADVRRAVMEIRAQSVVPDGRPLFQVVSDVVRGQGWTSHPPQGATLRERWDALGALMRLVDEFPPDTSVRTFSDELLRRSKIHHEPAIDAVTLSSIHAAKGREWPVVCLIGVAEGLLPIAHAAHDEAIDEERRLFYVGMTRAREELWVSGAAGRLRTPRRPSRFLAEAGIRHAGDNAAD